MEEICVNVSHLDSDDKITSRKQTGPRSSERRFHGAVVLCLGLLSVFLLARLIGLAVHHYNSVQCSATEVTAVKNNLTELLQASYEKILSLNEERDLLKTISNHMENNLTELRAQLTAMTEKSDWPNDRCCPTGWKMFGRTCYLLSVDRGSWDKGRQDCRGRGADLVVIDSQEEQVFLSDLTPVETWSWIGLTDKEVEGTWKWIDGSSLTTSYWDANQPDNGGGDPNCGEEDCAHIQTGKETAKNWNDQSCDASLRWICEKMA